MLEVTSNLGTDLKRLPSQLSAKITLTKNTCLPGLCQRFCIIKIAEGHERLVSLVIVDETTKAKKINEKQCKKKEDNESEKNFGCAKATNFELEIEDRGHLADYETVEREKRGDQEDRTCMYADEL